MKKKFLAALLALAMLISCSLAEIVPSSDENVMQDAEAPAKVNFMDELPALAEQLVCSIAEYLVAHDYKLEFLTSSGSQNLHISSDDGKTIQVDLDGSGMLPIRIRMDSTGISDLNDDESYTYGELLDQLLFGIDQGNIAGQVFSLLGKFDEYDLDFLNTAGQLAYHELMNAGVLPVIKHIGGDTYFTVSISPDLIETAAVRFVERLLEHQIEIDSLLVRVETLLRELVPEIFEKYDPETDAWTEREGYTCEELQQIFETWITQNWLRSWLSFGGLHLDITGRIRDDGWHINAEFFMPEGDGSVWFELCGNESGCFDGILEYYTEAYSRVTERYENQVFRFNIVGELTDNHLSIRVRPETPISGFTGLRIDCAMDSSGLDIDVVTDFLNFRAELSKQQLDLSVVILDFLLDVHLVNYGSVPQGSLICRYGRNGISVKLNDTE